MGGSESKYQLNEAKTAKEELEIHLKYLENYKNQFLMRSVWQNDYFYVIAHSCEQEIVSKIYNKKLMHMTCTPDETMECSICLDPIKNNASKIEGCNHMFHTKCLKKHIKMNKSATCPLCRGGNDMDIITQINDRYSYNSSNSSYTSEGY